VTATLQVHPDCSVTAVECDPGRVAILRRKFGKAWHGTFQDYAEEFVMKHGPQELFDAVIMNPPFTERGDSNAWATHLQLAWQLLRPGGRMVAISPASYRFSTRRAAAQVRDLVDGGGGTVVELPEGTFRNAGTNVHAVFISVTKPN
jgi:predicted RNA methylase